MRRVWRAGQRRLDRWRSGWISFRIVAGVCREIGLAEWLDEQDTQSHERVSVGTATVAIILNGLGFSNRRLYLVPQFFATKAVERL